MNVFFFRMRNMWPTPYFKAMYYVGFRFQTPYKRVGIAVAGCTTQGFDIVSWSRVGAALVSSGMQYIAARLARNIPSCPCVSRKNVIGEGIYQPDARPKFQLQGATTVE